MDGFGTIREGVETAVVKGNPVDRSKPEGNRREESENLLPGMSLVLDKSCELIKLVWTLSLVDAPNDSVSVALPDPMMIGSRRDDAMDCNSDPEVDGSIVPNTDSAVDVVTESL